MNLTYEQCKSLKDAGFPLEMASQEDANDSKRKDQMFQYGKDSIGRDNTWWLIPSLSELIEACGEGFYALQLDTLDLTWIAISRHEWITNQNGSTAIEAVCNLFLALKGT